MNNTGVIKEGLKTLAQGIDKTVSILQSVAAALTMLPCACMN